MDEPDPETYPFPQNIVQHILTFFRTKLFRPSSLLLLASSIIWTMVSFWCLKKYNGQHKNDLMRFAYVTFIICTLNSTMGITEFFHENVMASMRSLLELLQAVLALPCLTTEVWLKYDVAQKEVAWLHTAIGLIPTYIFLFQHYTRQDLIDFTVVMNIVSLMGVGFLYRNLYTICGSILIFFSYCVFFFGSELSYEPMSRALYNSCMAAFTYCAYKSVI